MIPELNSFSDVWFRYMTSASLQGCLLAIVFLAAAWIFRRHSPALRHALLLIALIKFAVPPTLSLPVGLFYHVKPITVSHSGSPARYVAPIIEEVLVTEQAPQVQIRGPIGETKSSAVPDRLLPTPCHSPRILKPVLSGTAWLMFLHVAGALGILALVVFQKIRLGGLAAGAAPATDSDLCMMYEDLCAALKLSHRPTLLVSNRNHAPMTFGTWKPAIVLPEDLVSKMAISDLRAILGHELAHHRRRDLWLSWLQLPISMIWWFNPVVWILLRTMRSLREDCCDDLVVSAGFASGESYCRTLLQAARVASGKLLSGAAFAYIGESEPLRRRLKRIMTSKLITAPRLAWTGIVIVVLLALLFLPGIRKRVNIQNPISTKGSSLETGNTTASAGNVAGNNSAIPMATDMIPPTVIQVRVVEKATGRGIANAALLVQLAPSPNFGKDMVPAEVPHTDNDGRCTIPAPASPPAWIHVRADGYLPRSLQLVRGENMPNEYTFKLDKGGFIGGYVRDEAGKPVENAKISIRARNSLFNKNPGDHEYAPSMVYAQTGKSGRWASTEVVPNPEQVNLTLEHPEWSTIKYDTVVAPAAPAELASLDELKEGKAVLIMKSGCLVLGRVMDENGRGIEGCEIRHIDDLSRDIQELKAELRLLPVERTEGEGRFGFRIAKAAEVMILVQAKGFVAESHRAKVLPNSAALEFRLKKGGGVTGRVIDDQGNPVPDAQLGVMVGLSLEKPFSWQGRTNEDGRFLWDSAPAEALTYSVHASGFDDSSVVLAPFKEQEIRLKRLSDLVVTGKVTDAKTKMPIDAFKVSMMDTELRRVYRSVEGKNGEFTLSFVARPVPASAGGRGGAGYKFGILIEADGYAADTSQSVEERPGNHYMEVALVRAGNGLSGVVTFANGAPAPGARVFLCGGPGSADSSSTNPVMMNNIKSISCTSGVSGGGLFTAAGDTDASGRFSLKPVPNPDVVYAVHEKGFAALTADKVSGSCNIMLQPWGRIEGVLMIGRKPGGNQTVTLYPLVTPRPPDLRVSFRAVTDDQGRFEFASVPPGEYRIAHMLGTANSGQSANAAVRSGETASVKIGGTGRPLIGKIVISGSDPNAVPKIQSVNLTLKLPDENAPRPSDQAAYREWTQSEAYRARQRLQRGYRFSVEADGSFRLEDIPAGTYTLMVTASPSGQPGAQRGGPPRPEQFSKEIVIPEMPGGRSDDPLDLAVINFQVPAKK